MSAKDKDQELTPEEVSAASPDSAPQEVDAGNADNASWRRPPDTAHDDESQAVSDAAHEERASGDSERENAEEEETTSEDAAAPAKDAAQSPVQDNAGSGSLSSESREPASDTPQEASSSPADSASQSAPSAEGAPPPSTDGGGSPPPPADDPAAYGEKDAPDDEDEGDDKTDEKEMSFMDHLSELRSRLVRCAIAVGVGFLACYGFSKQLFEILMQPLVAVFPPDSKLIFTALPEAFFTYIKVAMVAGVLVTSPYIFYQIWCFVAPGLYDEERKYLIPIALFSGIFFAAGAWFGYSVVFPFAFEFFMDFATETIRPMPSLREYLSFSLKLLFAFGLIFELPLFIFFLARLGIVTAAMLRKVRKYAFLCAFIVSAILTPPDVVSQVLMAGPLIILYEISIWVAHVFGKKSKQAASEDEDDTKEQDKDQSVAAS